MIKLYYLRTLQISILPNYGVGSPQFNMKQVYNK